MGAHSLDSSHAEGSKPSLSGKMASPSVKFVKRTNRAARSVNSNVITVHSRRHIIQGAGLDGRHNRVWKACERCRMKKSKCDGSFPCKRCKDDGIICAVGLRKKAEYKRYPKGYAEVLENTQRALIATVRKLYSMVRQNQHWDMGEPELNERGQPIIHDIAHKLACICPDNKIDLLAYGAFPEDRASMNELARRLEDNEHNESRVVSAGNSKEDMADRASSFKTEHSSIMQDNSQPDFEDQGGVRLSLQSSPDMAELEFGSAYGMDANTMLNTLSWSTFNWDMSVAIST